MAEKEKDKRPTNPETAAKPEAPKAPEKVELPKVSQEDEVKEINKLAGVSAAKVEQLQGTVTRVSQECAKLQEENTQLRKALDSARSSVKSKGDHVVLDGKTHKITLVEEAKEFLQCVRRSEVEDDRTVVVIDRFGA